MINLVVRAQKADLVCFLETKVREMSLKVVKSFGTGRFMDWGAVNVGGVSGGIMIFWDNRVLELLELECGGFTFLVASGMWKMALFGCSLVSMAQSYQGKKHEFWEELGAIKDLWDDPWCVGEGISIPLDFQGKGGMGLV